MEPFSVDDLLRYELVRDVQVHAARDEVIYETRVIDREANTYRSALTIAGPGREPLELVHATAANTLPRWSPDGRQIAFVSDRDGTRALYVIPRDGGEARSLGRFAGAVQSHAWSPDGAFVVVCATHPFDVAADAPRRIVRARYKTDGTGFLGTATPRLYRLDVRDGTQTSLTGEDEEALTPVVSPDGARIAFVKHRTGARDSHRTDVWMSPAWSPDGRWIAFLGDPVDGNSLARPWLVDVATGELRDLGEDLDATTFPLVAPSPPQWSADGTRVLFLAAVRGRSEVAAVDVETRRVTTVLAPRAQVICFHAHGDRVACIAEDAETCGDVFVARADGSELAQRSHTNAWWRDRTALAVERLTFATPHGDADGWVVRAADAARPGPLLVDVHGGPQSFAELGFPYHVYWYVLAARGWTILALDPIGSSGYGREHAMRLRERWGELDLPQQLAAVEQLQRDDIADERVAIGGKSYGGYLAALAIGTTDRFRAAFVSAPVADFISHSGTSDSGDYVDAYDLGGELWDKRELAIRLSPVTYAHRARAATLILQGEDDERCPRGQSEQLFSALVRSGTATAELILYPGGSHALAEDGDPRHRLDYHRRIVDWLVHHVEA